MTGDKAASVLARIKNKANKSGKSNQFFLQLFCQEEFLRRLEKSKYNGNLVLKGGLFLYLLTDFDGRITVDIDFLLQRIPNTPERIKEMLEEIIKVPTGNDFISFEVRGIVPISIAKEYTGVRASLVAYIKNTRTPFSIDFGVGDAIVPNQEKRKIPTQLSDFDAPIINTYSVETTVAEKLDTILNLMEFSSRMKDYYDIYYLACKFNFDGATLFKALKKTFDNRGRAFSEEQFECAMNFDKDAGMQRKWAAFSHKIGVEPDEFSTVLEIISIFLTVPFEAVIKNTDFCGEWSASDQQWDFKG